MRDVEVRLMRKIEDAAGFRLEHSSVIRERVLQRLRRQAALRCVWTRLAAYDAIVAKLFRWRGPSLSEVMPIIAEVLRATMRLDRAANLAGYSYRKLRVRELRFKLYVDSMLEWFGLRAIYRKPLKGPIYKVI